MNATTFKSRAAKSNNPVIVKKDGTFNTLTLKMIERDLPYLMRGHAYHPVNWSKSKGHFGLRGTADRDRMLALLTAAGVDFETGNDAPKGGLSGYYIRLTKKGLSQLKGIDFRNF